MAQGASSRRRREPWGSTKTLQLEQKPDCASPWTQAVLQGGCCAWAPVANWVASPPGSSFKPRWSHNDQPPRFCHACKHIFWSMGLLCTTPPPGQVTEHHCFTLGKGCSDAGKAGGLLQTHLPMPTHPEKPLVPATGTKNPLSLCHLRMPWAHCSSGGHWLLSHTRTSVGKWARAQTLPCQGGG